MKKYITAVIFIISSVFIISCKDESSLADNSSTSKVNSQTAEQITVKHQLGETRVNLNPQHVVVFDFGTLDTLKELKVDIEALPKQLIPNYLSEFNDPKYANVGSLKEPNFEAISKLSPELIIISGRQAELYDEFSKIAPTIFMGVDNKKFIDSFKENIQTLGKIFGKEDEAKKVINEINAQLSSLKSAIKEKKSAQKALVLIAAQGDMSAFGSGSRFGLIYDEFGFTPVDTALNQSTHGQKISYEYLIDKNPDILFIVDRGEAIGEGKSAEEMFKNELIKGVSAVKNNHVIYLNGDAWYLATGGIQSFNTMVNEIKTALNYE